MMYTPTMTNIMSLNTMPTQYICSRHCLLLQLILKNVH